MARQASLARDKIPYALNPMGNLTGTENKGERALEYIAHYLDRIESHMDRIATSLEADAGNGSLRLVLMNIENAIKNHS